MVLRREIDQSGEECLKLAGDSQIERFTLRFELPDTLLSTLTVRFPQIKFSVVSDNEFAEAVIETDAAMVWKITPDELATAKRLKWVHWVGAGVDRAPLAALKERGIVFTNNSGAHATNIAEHILSLMLSFCRALPFLFEAQRQGVWADDEGRRRVSELSGSSLLVIGAGKIGMALAVRAQGLGQRVTVVGRTARFDKPSGLQIYGIKSLEPLIPTADHIAICTPLTELTRGLFDRRRLLLMKPGAFLYNIGRGAIVDTEALLELLESGKLGGAGLDVTDPEPPPAGHPLWNAPNVVLTAHTSGAAPRLWERSTEILVDNLERYLSGQRLNNIVDYEQGY
ncbi:D-2-hydroxyacid dehydrogenase [soil metagenome]